MKTLIDVAVLLIAYASLSGVCSILLHLLSSSPTRGNRDAETTRGRIFEQFDFSERKKDATNLANRSH
jgi:hypothetical protein